MDCCKNSEDDVINKPTVLIIGAGFGGLSTSRQLVMNGGSRRHNVIMVDEKTHFSIGGMWQFVWNNRMQMKQVMWPLEKANLPGVDLRLGIAVEKWLPKENKIILQNKETIVYQHLVLACGVIPDPKQIPGIENFVNICSESHVERQKREMADLIEQAKNRKVVFCLSITVNPYKCPPAPYELVFLVDEMLRNHDVRDNARVIVTCPVDWTMPPNTKSVFMEAFEKQDIEFIPFKELECVRDDKIYFKDSIHPLEFTVLWTVWPIRAPDFVQESGVPMNSKGTVTVGDKVTNTIPGVQNAHIIGDACRVPFGEKAAVPKAGEFAWKMGISVADAIADKKKPADRSGKCTAEAGFGNGFVLTPNFTDVCNDPNGKPRVGISFSKNGTNEKVQWCNEYLQKIFGDDVEPVEFNSETAETWA